MPNGFERASGIRALFPGKQSAKVSQLKAYRFKEAFSLATGSYRCIGSVKATGSAKWMLSGKLTASGAEFGIVRFNVGFAFKLPVDGYVRTAYASDDLPIHASTISRDFYVSGQDPWIVDHWPTAFGEGVTVKLVASDDLGELIHELSIVVGVGLLVLVSGGSVSVGF